MFVSLPVAGKSIQTSCSDIHASSNLLMRHCPDEHIEGRTAAAGLGEKMIPTLESDLAQRMRASDAVSDAFN